MGTKSTAIQSWAMPTCGCACDFCNQADEERALEAAVLPVAPTAKPAAKVAPTARSGRLLAVPVPSVDDVFGRELADY